MRHRLFHTAVVAILTPLCSLMAGTIRVPSDQPTVQAGIDAASEGDTVLVAPGIYTGPGNYNIRLDGKGLAVRSESGPAATIVDCGESGGGFRVVGPMAFDPVVEGFTVKNGVGSWYGGGLHCDDQSMTLRNCVFVGNTGENGGALMFEVNNRNRTDNYVVGCTFYGNSGFHGGVYYHRDNVNTTFERCVMFANQSSTTERFGPVRYSEHWAYPTGSLTFECCNIYDNTPVNWYYLIAEQAVQNGNFSQPPLFCDPEADLYTVHGASPLLAQNNPCGVDIGVVSLGCSDCRDDDLDGLCALDDNCPLVANVPQLDSDLDGIGDACEDEDGDGVVTSVDNCPLGNNLYQEDMDSDGMGDVCDDDIDGDGWANDPDNCPENYNPGQEDRNGDGIGDLCCCVSRVGDADGLGTDKPTIGDISILVEALYIRYDYGILPCLSEADVNQSGGCNPTEADITIGDIAFLIWYLFFDHPINRIPYCLDCP